MTDATAPRQAAPDPQTGEAPTTQTDVAGDVWPAGMVIVNGHLARSIRQQGAIQPASGKGYIHLAAEVERPWPLARNSPKKRALLEALKSACRDLQMDERVERADLFNAFLVHPGARESAEVLAKASFKVHRAAFDVVCLVQCQDVDAARQVRDSAAFLRLKGLLDAAAQFVHCITASNPKQIAPVDHDTDGLFLFNYFFAADVETKAQGREIVAAVWEYTAGWWTAKANLDNSTPLQPVPGQESHYALINHCRWDRLIDVLPSLVLRPSLHAFVVRNFTANDVVSMPILYWMVR